MTEENKTYQQLKLDNQLCFRLYTASRLITQEYEPLFKNLDITYTQYLVLLVLWEMDDQPINDIGKKLFLGINTTSPLIKRMEKLNLVLKQKKFATRENYNEYCFNRYNHESEGGLTK